MRRVVSAILGINTIVISGRKYNLVRYDKNLQFVHIQLTEEINYNDYNMVVKYRMPDGNILADILEMETNEFDIQIPNEVVQLSGELAIEFTLSGKENDDSLTSLGRIKLTIQDTLESNIDQEEIRVLPTVANVLSRITEYTKEGITEIEKSKDEAIEELKKSSDSNVEESKEQVNIFTSQKQEQLDTYTKTKESQLDEYTLLKQGDMDSYTSTKKNNLDTYEKIKEKQIDDYVSDNSKPSLDKYVKEKNIELDSYTGKKKSELDVYEQAKEGQLDSHTNTKKEELNQHTVQKQGQLDEYTTAKKGELDTHTGKKKNELNTHEKAKEKELDSYITTVNKPELDSYTNIKKEELNSHTKTKESEITQVTETKKQEITAHSSNELDKFNQGAKQEADKQIGRVVAEGDVQVQRVKDESEGVIPRIEELESGKVSKSGDTMTGGLTIESNKNSGKRIELTDDGQLISDTLLLRQPKGEDKFPDCSKEYNYLDNYFSKYMVSNNALTFFGNKGFNTRHMGIQVGHSDKNYSSFGGILELNPYGGDVKINNQIAWHTGNLDLQNLQPLTIESNVGNHIVLKRSGELKGSLTSNVDGIALYNEKSGKMLELKDNGDIQTESPIKFIKSDIAMLVGTYIEGISDINEFFLEKPFGFNFGITIDATKYKNMFPYDNNANAIVNFNTFNEDYCHQFGLSSNGEIYHRSKSYVYGIKDWVRMANETDINNLKKEIAELRAEIQKLKELKGDDTHEN